MRVVGLLAAAGLVVCGLVGRAQVPPDARVVKVLQEWKGGSDRKEDSNLWKAAPRSGVIADAAAWADLWKAWHGGGEPPAGRAGEGWRRFARWMRDGRGG